jgi:hypothetical protein
MLNGLIFRFIIDNKVDPPGSTPNTKEIRLCQKQIPILPNLQRIYREAVLRNQLRTPKKPHKRNPQKTFLEVYREEPSLGKASQGLAADN